MGRPTDVEITNALTILKDVSLDQTRNQMALAEHLQTLLYWCLRTETDRFQEALSIIRSAQTNTVYSEAKAFIEKIESK